MKAVDRSAPGGRGGSSTEAKAHDNATRRRKISVGPIDFEQRREHIRLAYSKSLRESQALEARQKAAEKRRKEMEAAAKAKAAAEAAAASANIPSSEETLEPRAYVARTQTNGTDDENVDETPAFDSPTDPDADNARHLSQELSHDAPSVVHDQPSNLTTPLAEVPINNFDSPDLGVPGSFPAFSPPMDHDDPPLSAVSATSETTEFDVEEPDIDLQDKPESPVTVPITIVKPPSPQPPLPRQRAEYQDPFEEETDLREEPTREVDIAPDWVNETVEAHAPSQFIPGAFEEDEVNDTAVSPHDLGYETMVTILPPEEDTVSLSQTGQDTIPFPRIDMQYESDCHTDMEDAPQISSHHDHGDTGTDACSDDTEDHGRTDECQSESRFGDHASSRRESSCASSDDMDDISNLPLSQVDTSQSLMVPQMRGKRSSQQSAWTDFSVESSGPSNVTPSPDLDDAQGDESPTFGHVTIFGSQVISQNSDATSKEVHDIDERSHARPAYSSAASSAFLEQNQFPDVNGGHGINIPYLSQGQSVSLPHVPLPDHEPPPIPTPISASAMDSRRASSVFYEQSQNDSTLMHSERGSDDFASQLETPQTTDSNSIGGAEQWFGVPSQTSIEVKAIAPDGEELSDKERHRLVQRRNVIKELVDTEAVFVRDMNIVEEIYKGTAEACPKLEVKTVKQIFRNSDEIIEFHTVFLAQLKDAVVSVYVPKGGRSSKEDPNKAELNRANTMVINDTKDRATAIGQAFKDNIEKMKTVHETFLKSSDQAARKLILIQQDPTVKVWLNECNEVAKELTAAWDLDSLLIKPMQRITKYPNLIITLLQHTPAGHPDRDLLLEAKDILETAIIEINQTKKNFELVGQIVGRQRKGSDVKTGFARAFGKRVDKFQPTGNRPPEDTVYAKLNEKFGDDYLRLQVVLRDVEFYTRQVTSYVREFLNYLSSIELVMRLQPGPYPELESKWVQFNISVRDLEKVALEEHVSTKAPDTC